MKNKKCIIVYTSLMICAMILGGAVVNKHDMISILVDQNVEALTDPAGEGWWEGKKLKAVDCVCSNGDEGFTLLCKDDGTLEDCSATMQGSQVCYRTPTVFNQTLNSMWRGQMDRKKE